MPKLARLHGFVIAACALLAGCFASDAPLFDPAHGDAVIGRGRLEVTMIKPGETPESQILAWTETGYTDPADPEDGAISFHHFPGALPWSGWFIGQTRGSNKPDSGYLYELYHKQGGRLLVYDLSCKDLTPAEAIRFHLVVSESGSECKATRAEDLAEAFRLLRDRKEPQGRWEWVKAK